MPICSTCGDEMSPLFVGFFCRNDCDRVVAPLEPNFFHLDQHVESANSLILRKVAPKHREFLAHTMRGQHGTWHVMFLGDHRGWVTVRQISRDILTDSNEVLRITEDPSRRYAAIEVLKSRNGYREFRGIPDYQELT